MNQLTIEEIKKIQLSILKFVDEVCTENNIPYYLCGGTLLGAIRHKGYIPWDDDIDIMLLRPDYMRLVNILEKRNDYKCLSMYNQDDYFYPFAKLVDSNTVLIENNSNLHIANLGVYIDLFPIDALPDNAKERHNYYQKMMILRTVYYHSLSHSIPKVGNVLKYPAKIVVWLFSRTKGWKYWLNKIETLARKYDNETSEYVGCVVAGYGEREIYHRSIYEGETRTTFEGGCFAIPKGYDEYLKCLYDDYMQLPPVDKRNTRHDYVAYKK